MMLNLLTHQHSVGVSPVHRMPASWKAALGLVIILGTVTAPQRWTGWFVGVFLILGVGIGVSRVPPAFLLKRLLLLVPLIVGVALASLFQPVGNAPWLGVGVKSSICLLTVILISYTTPFSQLLKLLRLARVPNLLITTVALMHRYLAVLADEAERMRRARQGRTFRRQRRLEWRTLSTVISQLFVRSSERAERIYRAMCARGWK